MYADPGEELCRAHGEKTHVFVHFFLAKRPEFPAQKQQFADVPRPERGRIGWRAQQGLAYELGIPGQVGLEAVHGVRIVRRMTFQFEIIRFCVGIGSQCLPVVSKINGTQVRYQYQAVTAEVEIAVQRLAQHAANIGGARIDPALMHLARCGCAANVVIFFKDDNVQPGLRQVGGIGQTVVARADDDGVVLLHRRISPAAL
jgi:hypothetical protein